MCCCGNNIKDLNIGKIEVDRNILYLARGLINIFNYQPPRKAVAALSVSLCFSESCRTLYSILDSWHMYTKRFRYLIGRQSRRFACFYIALGKRRCDSESDTTQLTLCAENRSEAFKSHPEKYIAEKFESLSFEAELNYNSGL